jgi:lipoprotein NlpD
MVSMMMHSRLWLLGLVLTMLVSCAPVRDWNPLDYSVRPGDTLYSIAWRYEMDFQDIARWNNINPPYAIYPGQRLKLSPDDGSGSFGHDSLPPQPEASIYNAPVESDVVVPVVETPVTEPEPLSVNLSESVSVQKGDTLFSIAQRNGLSHSQLARWNALHPPYSLHVGQILKLRPPTDRYTAAAETSSSTAPVKSTAEPVTIVPSGDKRPAATPQGASPVKYAPVSAWHWPVRGRVIKTFSNNDTARKGIGIAGKAGQPVLAAAGGRVVYSGNGLISYGNLIIIKHDDYYLSAYAHNQELLVAEGDEVRVDQMIARMGENNGRAQLHFEIRKNGKPVNPLQYLPRG